MKSNIRILIVEDEAFLARKIESHLRAMGYEDIDIAITYNRAINSIKRKTPDLILLDIDLKCKYNGIDIANDKMVLNKIPVIYLTMYKDSQTKEKLMATNPAGYLTKPPRYDEMEVNIQMALGHKNGTIDIGYDFSYDLTNRNLLQKNQSIKLSENEKNLLEKLIEYRGEPIPLNVLEFEIWGNEPMSPSSLRTLVAKLRKKLDPDMIVTVLSHGYILSLPKD